MAVEDEGVFNHAVFKGLRNNVGTDGFELGDLDAAQNVDIDDAGDALLRRGHPAASIAGATHSLWSDGTTCLAVNAGSLVQIHPDLSTSQLRSGMSDAPVSYDSPPGSGRVYWSDGVRSGVVEAGRNRSWGLEVPPTLSARATGGALPPGRYQFAATFLRIDGQESGAARAGLLELTSTGGLEITVPQPSDTDVVEVAVYVSKTDGAALYYERSLSVGTTSTTVAAVPTGTRVLAAQHLSNPPAGSIVAYFAGRMLVAANGVIYPSRPYAYELFDLREAVPFGGARIDLLAPVSDGVFVAAGDQTIFLAGRDPSTWVYTVKAAYGAIPGTAVRSFGGVFAPDRDEQCVMWASPRGVCAGFDGGRFVNFTEDRFAFPVQPAGAGVIRPWRGTQQYITTLRGQETPGNIGG